MDKVIIIVVMLVAIAIVYIFLGIITAYLINYLGFWTTLTWQQGVAINTLIGIFGSFFHSSAMVSKK